MPKLFLLKGFPIGFAGFYNVKENFLPTIIDEYNKKLVKKKESIDSAFLNFRSYLISKSALRKGQAILGAGYCDDLPIIFAFNDQAAGVQNRYLMTTDDPATVYGMTLIRENMHARNVVPLVEKLIDDYAIRSNRRFLIGGPISIILISPSNKVRWVQNKFDRTYFKNYKTLYKGILENKIDLIPLGEGGVEESIDGIKEKANL